MIRRQPTLIHMSDTDVQEIRDVVEKERADEIKQQNTLQKLKQMAENPSIQKEDLEFMEKMRATVAHLDNKAARS